MARQKKALETSQVVRTSDFPISEEARAAEAAMIAAAKKAERLAMTDDDRVSLAPLDFEQALKGLLATPPPKKG